mmetsp:Transcript_6602/g.8563  ORF Transcript_6602/g.8563 Transcript_6602/m.8563 type:complete len:224 (-) Transcript_6602:197-868(-)
MFLAAAVTSAQRVANERRELDNRNRPPVQDTFNEILNRVKKADDDASSINPGDLAVLENGSNAMKSALDIGNLEAIGTLVRLDGMTLTSPCCVPSITPLQYLKREPHPFGEKLIPLIEGLLLERGFVPFANGCAIDVDTVLLALVDRSEDHIKKLVTDGKIDFKQFKTLRDLQGLPIGIEKDNAGLAFLIDSATRRINPDAHLLDIDDDGQDDPDAGGGCVIA